MSGKDVFVDGGGELLFAEDEPGAWSAQCLVGGAGDDLRVRNWRRMHAAGDKAREVSHINNKDGAAFVSDGAHTGKVECARIRAAAADDDFGLLAQRRLFELIVVDGLGIFANAVGDDFVELAGEVQLVAVSEVSAVSEIEAEDGIAGLEN